jgi:predicted dehydrogenase
MVAEQLRFDQTFTKGAELIREKVGKVYAFSLELYAPVKEDDKFYNTSWRGIPAYQGGFLLDGGVHFVAGLRKLLDEEIDMVCGFSRQIQVHTPPVDTLHAVIKLMDGTSGTIGLSWGCKSFLYEIRVIGEGGCVRLTMGKVSFEDLLGGKEEFEFKETGGGMDAVRREVEAFAKSIEFGKGDVLGAPEEGLRDVAFIEMVLKSSERGGEPMKFDFY